MAEGEGHMIIPMFSINASGKQKVNLAVRNLMAAALFVRKAGEIEEKHKGESLGPFFDEESFYVISSIMMAVGAMESRVNEYIEDNIQTIPSINNAYNERGLLKKCQKVLTISKKAVYDENGATYRNADTLIKFRNAYVHFKPEWDDNQVKHKEIAEKIIGLFEMNPYFSISDPVFPLRALSYGCGKWAVIVSKDFIDEFDVKLDMSKLTDIFREQLNTAIK